MGEPEVTSKPTSYNDVACHACKAKPGEPCVGTAYPHNARKRERDRQRYGV